MARQGELESGAGTRLRLGPDLSTVELDDLLADGQADAVARVFTAGVQTLKGKKDAFQILGGNSDSVILHAEEPVFAGFFNIHGNYRLRFVAELDGVADEILED